MTRLGILLTSTLVIMACLHTQQTEDETIAEDNDTPAAKKDVPPKAQRASRKSEAKRPAFVGRPELGQSASSLMRPEAPFRIQMKLQKKGYLPPGPTSGKVDEETSAALRKFQADQGMARTGAPDRETLAVLGLAPDEIWDTKAQGKDR